jgi:predicted Zn-dependent protease
VQGERTTIDGLDAFIGGYEGQIEGLGPVYSRAAHIAYDGRIYLIAGIVSPDIFAQADPAFTATIRSFRRLTASEAESIRPHRVDLYVVRPGDTWAALAERSGGAVSADTLAVMNQQTPGSQPPVGARIKIVVEG